IFFFQAEDGIRGKLVTGVQTCALPISSGLLRCPASLRIGGTSGSDTNFAQPASSQSNSAHTRFSSEGSRNTVDPFEPCKARFSRSEERRVGKECRSRLVPYE